MVSYPWVCVISLSLGAASHQGGECESGSCRAPTASLMQLDVQGSQKQLVATRDRSSRSVALAGFENYARELASKFILADDNYTGHETGLNDDEKAAIESIKAFIDQAAKDWRAEHVFDSDLVKKDCDKEVEKCVNETYGNFTGDEDHVKLVKDSHNSCRQNQQDFVWTNCIVYDDHRKSSDGKLPTCVKNGYLTFAAISQEDTGVDGELRTHVEPCLDKTKEWMDKIHPLYMACYHERLTYELVVEECKRRQKQFENAECDFGRNHDQRCDRYGECLGRSHQGCEALCDDIEAVVEARTADNETAERVKCLLDVLLDENQFKKGNLTACLNKNYDYAADWKIKCPDGIEQFPNGTWPRPQLPAGAIPCQINGRCFDFVPDHVPCSGHILKGSNDYTIDDDWYAYSDEDWHTPLVSKNRFNECESPCPAQ